MFCHKMCKLQVWRTINNSQVEHNDIVMHSVTIAAKLCNKNMMQILLWIKWWMLIFEIKTARLYMDNI